MLRLDQKEWTQTRKKTATNKVNYVKWLTPFDKIDKDSPIGKIMLSGEQDYPSTIRFEYPKHPDYYFPGVVWLFAPKDGARDLKSTYWVCGDDFAEDYPKHDIQSNDLENAPEVWVPMDTVLELINANQMTASDMRALINSNAFLKQRFIDNQMIFNRMEDITGGQRFDRTSSGQIYGRIPIMAKFAASFTDLH